MTYTVTCPDPDCKKVFTLEEADFGPIYDTDGVITCPGTCGCDYEWDFDPDKSPEITLTEVVEYEEESPETCEVCGFLIDECECEEGESDAE